MDNFDIILEKDEKVIFETRLHWIFFKTSLSSVLFGLIVLAVLQTVDFFSGTIFFGLSIRNVMQAFVFVFVSIGAIDSYLNYKSSSYMITSKRVIVSHGWIIKNMRDILLSRIEGVQVRQTIAGRFLNYGSIVIYGMGTCVDRLPLTPDPFGFRSVLQERMSLIDSKI